MFKIVSSSAGSGKTYTLTKEYLKLILGKDNAFYFKHILAITFTKAATREMKERILGRLEAFSKGESDPMLRDIIAELYPESLQDPEGAYRMREQEIRRRSEKIFRQILHDYSDFAVMTIDSFVQRIVSAFTEELGIPFSFEVEMEADELLIMAVERLLEKVGDESFEEITDILESFYLEASQEGRNYHSLPEVMANFARDLLNEQKYAAIQENKVLTAKDFKKIRRQMVSAMKRWENQIIHWAEAGKQLILDNGLDEKDFSHGTVYKYFAKRTDADKAFEVFGARETDAFENDKGWYSKTSRDFVRDTIEKLKPELTDYYELIKGVRTQKASLYRLYEQLVPHLYNLSLLNAIKEEFDRQLRENNRVHISEFNQKILKIVTEDPVPFIYERLGEKFNHILIDEFQDTSKLQFANLLPLIDNSLGYEHFNLAVGDSKQAIYRFRGGDMEQIIGLHSKKLDRLYESLGASELNIERLENIRWHLKPDALNTNRRSAKEVIEFNNTFFRRIAEYYTEQFPMTGEVFNDTFQQLVPDSAPKGGQVQIEFLDAQSADDENTPVMLPRTLEIVESSIAEGFTMSDISVLCRSKKDAKLIANHLKDNGYNIISEDSLSLRFSGAVNLVTAFMKVLVKPDSRLDKYEALYLFFRLILKRIPNAHDNQAIKTAVESHDVRNFYAYVNGLKSENGERKQESGDKNHQTPNAETLSPYRLLQISAYELAEKLVQAFGLFELQNERDYLFRFLDVVLEFNTQRGTHLADFLDHWETQKDKVSISAPSDPEAITVQTIHRSKGLEYPIVIVPYADWEFVPNAKRDSLWVTLQPTDELQISTYDSAAVENGETIHQTEVKFLKTGSVQLKSDLDQTPEHVAGQYQSEKERVFLENLNLLYVAFTRPTRRLHVLAKAQDFSKSGSQKRISYWLHLYETEQLSNASVTLTQLPNSKPQNLKINPNSTFFIPHIITADRSRNLHLRRLADRVFDVETFERKKDHGNKVHYALSLVRTPDDVPKALVRLQSEGIIEKNEAESIQKSLNQILQHPQLQGLFGEQTNALNEREILTPDGNLHRPDRVIRFSDRVVVLDYKTGAPAESHQKQIKRYKKLYLDMGYENVEAKLVYIEKNEVVTV